MDITKLVNVDDLLDKDIFELLGIENAGEDRKEEIFNRMIQTVNMRVATRIASMLTQEEATKFQDLAESGNADALAEFLTEKDIDLPNLVAEEATRYRVEMVTLVKMAEVQK